MYPPGQYPPPQGGYPPPYGHPPPYGPPPFKKSSNTGLIVGGIILGGFVLLMGTCLVGLSVAGRVPKEEQPKLEAERRAEIDAITQKLLAIRDRYPTTPQKAACPAGRIPVRTPDAAPHYIEWDTFGRLANPAPPKRRKEQGMFSEKDPWWFANSLGIRDFRTVPEILEPLSDRTVGDSLWSARYIEKGKIVVVFKATKKSLPKLREGGFDAGIYYGWAVVFDYAKADVLCAVPLLAESSEVVKHRTRGMFAKDADKAITDDFKDQFREEAHRAMKEIAPAFDVKIDL